MYLMIQLHIGSITCPIEADFLFAFATPNNYECYLTKKNGSPFIQHLVKTIHEKLCRRGSIMHLEDILLSVKRKIAEELIKVGDENYRQMASIVSQMRDKLWLKLDLTHK